MSFQVPTFSLAGVLSAALLAQPVAPPAASSDPYLVRNINPAGSSSPGGFVRYRGVVYFRADEGASGSELWRTDGSEAGTTLVHDINPGEASSAPLSITGFEGRVYFAATTAEQGRELSADYEPYAIAIPRGRSSEDEREDEVTIESTSGTADR